MSARRLIAVEIERGRLTAVQALVSSQRVEVLGWRTAQAPADLDLGSAEGVGKWLGRELREAHMRGRLVMVASRSDVVIKRLSLPPGLAPQEAPGAVALQMTRQLTVPTEGAAVDYIMLDSGAEDKDRAAEALAGAMPGERRQWLAEVAKASGLKLARIGLRSAGAAAALAPASAQVPGSLLGIVIGRSSTELVVVDDGQLVFARAIELDAPEEGGDLDDFARRLAIEAKRTWMSYRSQPTSIEVERICALGAGPLARAVADSCADALELSGETVEPHEAIAMPADMPERQRTLTAALIGTLAEGAVTAPGFDFANPRRAPDLGARRRQRALLGALAAILTLGSVTVYLWLDLQSMRQDLSALKARRSRVLQDYADYLAADARLKHMESWLEAGVDFVAHIDRIVAQMPDPEVAQLDTLVGNVGAGVEYRAAESRRYLDGRFVSGQSASFSIRGAVERRDIAQALRERLMTAGPYQLMFSGPDVETRFDLDLVTPDPAPSASEPTETAS